MTTQPIETLFASDIRRRIEEVIKVDQTDDNILCEEIDEYVVTDAIRSHYTRIFEAFRETPNKPHEGIGVWVSGESHRPKQHTNTQGKKLAHSSFLTSFSWRPGAENVYSPAILPDWTKASKLA